MNIPENADKLRIRGRTEVATYRTPELPEFGGNPLIEALPAVWDWEREKRKVVDELTKHLPIIEEIENAPLAIRQQRLGLFKLQFFQVINRVRDIEVNFSILLRNGYLGRNPADPRHRRNLRDRIKAIQPGQNPGSQILSLGNLGFALLGSPGLGKTRTIERIMQLYPQVILHENYPNDPSFKHIQVVWLYLTCSHDSSTKGLCNEFFTEVDEVLGTDSYRDYRGENENTLVAGMSSVAGQISLGALAIDEIEFLDPAKSGGKSDLMRFLVQLENQLRIPVILVGTNKAAKLIGSSAHLARRGVGTGGRIWLPFKSDDSDWNYFLRTMWEHQYVKNYVPFDSDFARLFYEETQGIPSYAVDLHYYTQLDAMNNGSEKITVDGIMRAAREYETVNRPYVLALKSHDRKKYAKVLEDILPPNLENPDEFFRDELNLPPVTPAVLDFSVSGKQNGENKSTPANTSAPIPPFEARPTTPPITETPPIPKRKGKEKRVYPPGTIMALCADAKKQFGRAPYEALKAAGLIRDVSDILKQPAAA